ncbi:MAG: RHS repeat-associated core domain-containing protein [Clostridia bacterium]|nr:RHS repeat-associated core domain-containing protein [Clostridia bacterium]
MGVLNPIRYRGYYYDTETGLYYLNSRYYDHNAGRFLNADSPENLGANGSIISYNQYSYCDNNPIIFADHNGKFAITAIIVGALIGAAIGFGSTVAADYADDGEVFNGSISAGGYIANTVVGSVVGGMSGGVGSSTFTLTYPTLSLAATDAGLVTVVGSATVTVQGTAVLAGVATIGEILLFAKGRGPRIGHNQHEKQMWNEAMRQLNIKDKDLRRRLHQANEKYPYAETLKDLLRNLRDILSKWE